MADPGRKGIEEIEPGTILVNSETLAAEQGPPGFFRVRTRNDFYDGWMGFILRQLKPENCSEHWAEGWRMAEDTPLQMLLVALFAELDLEEGKRNVTVEWIED